MPSQLDGRGEEIYKALSETMHLYLGTVDEDARQGIDPYEHERRHAVYYTGFVAALNYCAEYPRQAMRLLEEVRKHALADKHRLTTDRVMAHVTEQLYPQGEMADAGDRLLKIADDYAENHETGTEMVRPVLTNGVLTWENTEGKLPFPEMDEFGPWDWGE